MLSRTLSVLFCVLYLTVLTLSAPAGPVVRLSSGSLGTPLPGSSATNITSGLKFLPNSNASNSDPAICHVTNTHTVLVIRFFDHHPVDPVSLTLTINAARHYVQRAIQVDGDVWLPASDDPFRYNINAGIAIGVRSVTNEHLRWGVLDNALRGFLECVTANEWYDEAHIDIFDGDSGHVGVGVLVNVERRKVALDQS